ncbi:putative esterase [Anaerobacterium chartisolvens]|uniref:Putative esterase n=2 Tax=Anaerobacterium chartisolvens TaxID=1297424 RepID=A0A369ATK9_9FIRM|nr:putative esterase [Anaerobacterium chartisolvens]
MDFQSYIEQTIYSCPYNITFSGNKRGFLNRWLVTGKAAQPHGDKSLEPYLGTDAAILYNARHTELAQEELESSWRYYCCTKLDDDTQIEYCRNNPEQMFSKDRDAYIYCLCCIHCSDGGDFLFFTDPQIPIRVWINGVLVFTVTREYMIKQHVFAVRLRKGMNSVLVEKPDFMCFKALTPYTSRFHLEFTPLEHMLKKGLRQFYDAGQLKILKNNYRIAPDKAFFNSGESIFITVIPRYIKDAKPEEIEVSVYDATGKALACSKESTFKRIMISLDEKISGTLLIKVGGCRCRCRNQSEVYVFKGDFVSRLELMAFEAEMRTDCDESISKTIRRMAEVPDIESSCFKNTMELITDSIYEPLLEQLFVLEGITGCSCTHTEVRDIFTISNKRIMVFKDSEIDDGFIVYPIHFPANYKLKDKHPLIIYFLYGAGYASYPYAAEYIERQMFEDAVILNICGRGGMNRDYISEGVILNAIDEVIKRFNIDRDKIFCVGECTGTLKAIGMALRKPDLFSGLIGIEGTARLDIRNPEFECLGNLDNIKIYQLNNIEDAIFNAARVIDTLKKFRQNKSWNFSGFSHIQFSTMLNSGQLLKIFNSTNRERYPKEIFFITEEPIYNKSYWIRLDYIESLGEKARIEAKIEGTKLIEISCRNIKRLALLLARGEMGLESSINISINGYSCNVCLAAYSESSITIGNDGIFIETRELTHNSFSEEYNCFQIDERLLGIKRVYYSRCTVIKPCGNDRKSALQRIFRLLKAPLKEKVRNYKYGVLAEDELSSDSLKGTSLVYIIAADDFRGIRHELIMGSGISLSDGFMEYRGKKYRGDYFALIRHDSPFDPEKSVLLAICSGGEAMTQMTGLLNSFDYSPAFYNDVIIYSRGDYEYFRST